MSLIRIYQEPEPEPIETAPVFVAGPNGWFEMNYATPDVLSPRKDGWMHPRPQHWHHLCPQAKRRDGFRCVVCNGTERLAVHHRTYARWGDELLDDVYTLCTPCHEVFHKNRRVA